MKRMIGIVVCGLLGCSITGAWGSDGPSIEKGEKLFASVKLGTSGKSCISCHPDGITLSAPLVSNDEDLADAINNCIAGPLKGKRLDPESSDMKSLVLFLKSPVRTDK